MVAGWFASHASKRPARYRPSPVTVDGYAELFQCRRVVKLLYDWQPRQGIEGSVCDDILG